MSLRAELVRFAVVRIWLPLIALRAVDTVFVVRAVVAVRELPRFVVAVRETVRSDVVRAVVVFVGGVV